MKAFQHSQRAEPLVRIAEYYKDHNLQGENKPEWHTCYMYSNMACQLIFPVSQILFVDKRIYTYKRHHLLGISAFYVGRYKEGKDACIHAIESENQEIDKNNLKFYLEKEFDILKNGLVSCPALIAASFADREVRTKDEYDIKHDKKIIITDLINSIAENKRNDSKPISAQHLDMVKKSSISEVIDQSGSGTTVSSNSTNKGITSSDLAQLGKMPRKDKRAKLRQLLKQRKGEEKKV